MQQRREGEDDKVQRDVYDMQLDEDCQREEDGERFSQRRLQFRMVRGGDRAELPEYSPVDPPVSRGDGVRLHDTEARADGAHDDV